MLERKQTGSARPAPSGTYAPAPESRDIVQLRGALRPLRRRRVASSRAPASGSPTISPATEEPLAEVAQAGAEDVDARRRRRARRVRERLVGAAGRPSARSTSSGSRASCRSARASSRCSSRSNGGKPIKESRDVDLPLAAAHFFYYAGWADKLEYAFPNRRPRPLGVAGQIIPWNFPLLMLAVEDRARARGGQHRRAQAGRDDAADGAALLATSAARPSCRRASSTSSPATADRRRARQARRASTRSRSPARPRSARRSSASSPARGKR